MLTLVVTDRPWVELGWSQTIPGSVSLLAQENCQNIEITVQSPNKTLSSVPSDRLAFFLIR